MSKKKHLPSETPTETENDPPAIPDAESNTGFGYSPDLDPDTPDGSGVDQESRRDDPDQAEGPPKTGIETQPGWGGESPAQGRQEDSGADVPSPSALLSEDEVRQLQSDAAKRQLGEQEQPKEDDRPFAECTGGEILVREGFREDNSEHREALRRAIQDQFRDAEDPELAEPAMAGQRFVTVWERDKRGAMRGSTAVVLAYRIVDRKVLVHASVVRAGTGTVGEYELRRDVKDGACTWPLAV